MEADWAAEIGPGLPVIDAEWAGFVDLRVNPFRLDEIPEAVRFPVLRDALIDLNDPLSPLFTVKCDVWELGAEEIDADEFGGTAGRCGAGLASYVDVVLRDDSRFSAFAWQERWAQSAKDRLRVEPLSCGRVDLVVRAAAAAAREGFGITLYAAGCGVDGSAARVAWERVLRAAVAATMKEAWASSSIG